MEMNKKEAFEYFKGLMAYYNFREDLYKMLHSEIGETEYSAMDNFFPIFYHWVYGVDNLIDENKYNKLYEIYESDLSLEEKFDAICKIKEARN